MSKSLFDLSTEYLVLQDLIEDIEFNQTTGEIIDNDEVIQELYNGLSDELSTKLDNVMYVITETLGKAEMLKQEQARLNKKEKTLRNKADLLRSLIFKTVSCLDDKKFKTDKFSFTIKKSQPSVHILSEDDLPRAYRVAKWSPDKNKIKEALKNGEEVIGCTLVQSESLQVR